MLLAVGAGETGEGDGAIWRVRPWSLKPGGRAHFVALSAHLGSAFRRSVSSCFCFQPTSFVLLRFFS